MLGFLRFLVFIVIIGCFFTVPLIILWNKEGFIYGLILFSIFLLILVFKANKKIATSLGFIKIMPAQNPKLFTLIEEYLRWLEIKRPIIGIIETKSINIAVFGFRPNKAYLAITTGLLELAKEDELSAVICRELTAIRFGNLLSNTIFCRFVAVFSKFLEKTFKAKTKNDWLYILINQVIFSPIYILMAFLLGIGKLEPKIDIKSIYYSQLPISLYEAIKKMHSYAERFPLISDVSTRHLFCVPPKYDDLHILMMRDDSRLKLLGDFLLKA